MTPEESSKQVKIIDKKIEQFAQYLQRKNNLDHIQFLKVRLGMQVVAGNIEKTVVLYGLSYFFDLLIFTFLTHISYFLLRIFAHGAHAKTSLQCHIQNIKFYHNHNNRFNTRRSIQKKCNLGCCNRVYYTFTSIFS